MKGRAIQLEQSAQQTGILKPVFDVKRGTDGKITVGLLIGATQAQNEALILISNSGEFKNAPTLGVGLSNALLSDTADMLRYRHKTRSDYQMEGLEISELDLFDLKNVKIVARYR
jgi:hypothetical protein